MLTRYVPHLPWSWTWMTDNWGWSKIWVSWDSRIGNLSGLPFCILCSDHLSSRNMPFNRNYDSFIDRVTFLWYSFGEPWIILLPRCPYLWFDHDFPYFSVAIQFIRCTSSISGSTWYHIVGCHIYVYIIPWNVPMSIFGQSHLLRALHCTQLYIYM